MTLGPFKRQPRQHQLTALERSVDAEYYGLLMEQRCGKSQVVLDTAAHQYRLGIINALHILAPNGVHVAWVTDEIREVLHEDTNYKAIIWRSGRMQTKAALQALDTLLTHPGLAVLSVNIDAILTDAYQAFAAKFLRKRRVMTCVDESL